MTDIKSILPLAHAHPPPSLSPVGTHLTVPSSLLVPLTNTITLRNTPVAPTHPPRATASPAKLLDNLPPKAAPIQESINLVKDKPLRAVVVLER